MKSKRRKSISEIPIDFLGLESFLKREKKNKKTKKQRKLRTVHKSDEKYLFSFSISNQKRSITMKINFLLKFHYLYDVQPFLGFFF